ncbi:MAG: hypothetical protein ABIJ91_04720 [Candidatus Kuenenbacteria bacterium]
MPKLPTIPYKLLEKNNREKGCCINLSDKLRILAKTTLSFLIHDNADIAVKNFPAMDKLFKQIQTKLHQNPYLYSVTPINYGPEEYIEALLVWSYMNNKPMPSLAKLKVTPETYLGALSDMTGELVRLARKNEHQAKSIHNYVAHIYNLIIPVSITKNSQLRNKLETIGNNLKKIEGIIYDLKLRDKI